MAANIRFYLVAFSRSSVVTLPRNEKDKPVILLQLFSCCFRGMKLAQCSICTKQPNKWAESAKALNMGIVYLMLTFAVVGLSFTAGGKTTKLICYQQISYQFSRSNFTIQCSFLVKDLRDIRWCPLHCSIIAKKTTLFHY